MMEAYTGLPGAGKSYVSSRAAGERLLHTSMFIVGNLAWKLSELNAYVQSKGRRFVDVFSRITMLSTEDCREFWRHRGAFTMLPGGSVEGMREVRAIKRVRENAGGKIPKGMSDRLAFLEKESVVSLARLLEECQLRGQVFEPVCYVIDESHVLFDARAWEDSSPALTYYNSQHRKFRDDVIMITQFLGLLEKRVRGFVERFHVMRNFAGATAMKILRMPHRMRELVYSVEPGRGVDSDREVWHKLDREWAQCYDTTAGVGIVGGRAPEVRKPQGLGVPWWLPFVGLACFAWLFWYGTNHMERVVGAGFGKVSRSASAVAPVVQEKVSPPAVVPSTLVPAAAGPLAKPVEPWATGVVSGRGRVRVTLSDGTSLDEGSVVSITSREVVLGDGRVLLRGVPPPARVSVPVGRFVQNARGGRQRPARNEPARRP